MCHIQHNWMGHVFSQNCSMVEVSEGWCPYCCISNGQWGCQDEMMRSRGIISTKTVLSRKWNWLAPHLLPTANMGFLLPWTPTFPNLKQYFELPDFRKIRNPHMNNFYNGHILKDFEQCLIWHLGTITCWRRHMAVYTFHRTTVGATVVRNNSINKPLCSQSQHIAVLCCVSMPSVALWDVNWLSILLAAWPSGCLCSTAVMDQIFAVEVWAYLPTQQRSQLCNSSLTVCLIRENDCIYFGWSGQDLCSSYSSRWA